MSTGNTRIVLSHVEYGVYLGSCLGFGFWSKCDPVGQDSAVTFPTVDAAREYLAAAECSEPITEYTFTEVIPDIGGEYASICEIARVGLPAWNPKAAAAAH